MAAGSWSSSGNVGFPSLLEVGDDDDRQALVVSGRERGRREGTGVRWAERKLGQPIWGGGRVKEGWTAAAVVQEGRGRGIEPMWLFQFPFPFLFPRLNMLMFKCYLNSNLNA